MKGINLTKKDIAEEFVRREGHVKTEGPGVVGNVAAVSVEKVKFIQTSYTRLY